MPGKRCEVCVNPKTGRAKWHSRESDCPAAKSQHPATPAVPVASPAPAGNPDPKTEVAPSQSKPQVGKFLVGRREGQTVRSLSTPAGDVPTPSEVAKKFLIDGPHTLEFWNGIVLPGVRQGFLYLDDWFEVSFHIDDKHFALSKFAQSQIAVDPETWYTRSATRLLTLIGAKDQQTAHGYIDDATFAAGFLGLGVAAVAHMKKVWDVSPKTEARRKKKEAAKIAKASAKLRGRTRPESAIPASQPALAEAVT